MLGCEDHGRTCKACPDYVVLEEFGGIRMAATDCIRDKEGNILGPSERKEDFRQVPQHAPHPGHDRLHMRPLCDKSQLLSRIYHRDNHRKLVLLRNESQVPPLLLEHPPDSAPTLRKTRAQKDAGRLQRRQSPPQR